MTREKVIKGICLSPTCPHEVKSKESRVGEMGVTLGKLLNLVTSVSYLHKRDDNSSVIIIWVKGLGGVLLSSSNNVWSAANP